MGNNEDYRIIGEYSLKDALMEIIWTQLLMNEFNKKTKKVQWGTKINKSNI